MVRKFSPFIVYSILSIRIKDIIDLSCSTCQSTKERYYLILIIDSWSNAIKSHIFSWVHLTQIQDRFAPILIIFLESLTPWNRRHFFFVHYCYHPNYIFLSISKIKVYVCRVLNLDKIRTKSHLLRHANTTLLTSR